MDEPDELRQAVEHLYGCQASFVRDVPVVERFGDQIAWEGRVSLFALKGHPAATECYAWSSPIDNSTQRRFYAVLKVPPISTPEEAVRASIIRDHRSSNQT